jgi:hypothetical protein
MDKNAPTLQDYLGPIIEMIEPCRTDDMRLVKDQTCRLKCNCKAVFDNFGELYHVEHIHPQHELIFDCPTPTAEYFNGGHTRVLIDRFTVNSSPRIPEEGPPNQWAHMKTLGMERKITKAESLMSDATYSFANGNWAPSRGYNYDRLSNDQLSDIVQYNIFPNTVLVLQPEEFWIFRSRPHATDPKKMLLGQVRASNATGCPAAGEYKG